MSNLSLKTIGLISILGLSACGGDDSDNTPPKEEPPPVTYVTIKGTAVSRDILSDATVTARCKDNSGFKSIVKTDEKGNWEGQVKSDQLPCRLKATKDDHVNMTHYSVIFNVDDHINITPFTDWAIVYKPYYAYLPSNLYKMNGREVDYILLKNILNENNSLLVKDLIEHGYNISPSTQVFTDIIDLDGNMIDNIKGFRIGLDSFLGIYSYSSTLKVIYESKYKDRAIVPNKVAIKTAKIFPNLDACKVGPSADIYTNCSNDLLNDFVSNDLVYSKYQNMCILEKKGDEIVYSSADNGIDVEAITLLGGYYDNAVKISNDGYKIKTYFQHYVPLFGASIYKLELNISTNGELIGSDVKLLGAYGVDIDHSVLKFTEEYNCVRD
ncbi:hypothetical protein ACG9XQ_04405 [Acinetobacter baumannii]|uniref:hypothetical protein n=1 Tax=Acinetobacter baumannii TaxID=470 RepID=UPI003AF86365